jgi:glucose-6-phosphate isomerase
MSEAWDTLRSHRQDLEGISLASLIDAADRGQYFTHQLGDLHVDLTRHLATDQTLELLFDLARERRVEALREAMFSGEPVNTTEDRAALHIALRNQSDRPILADGVNVMPEVNAVLRKMQAFCESVHNGTWRGSTGQRIETVINIGIGGSDLGPAMATEALRPWWSNGLHVRFVSNVDPSHLSDTIRDLDPETTLFIIASKTFGTQETLTNAHAARRWIAKALGETAVSRHFVAVSTNADRVAAFGIDTDNMFEFWDWVGGRYSMWSAIGLSIAMAIGFNQFTALLEGAHEMDCHFRDAPMHKNIPILLGLLDCWYRECWDCQSRAVLPYDQHLHRLPAYLQQLEMESNGKRTRIDGSPTTEGTAMIVWGEPGTNGQHSFHQMLHQGTTLVPCDFLVAATPTESVDDDRYDILFANCLAQAQALARGHGLDNIRAELEETGLSESDISTLAPQKVMPGNRPSTTFLYRQLDPATLGRLISLFEHRVFVQGAVWGIDSFDQWGVELGKHLATEILPGVVDGSATQGDATTRRLTTHMDALRRG